MRQKLIQLVVALFLLSPSGVAQPGPQNSGPQNLDFEKGELGGLPQGWIIPTRGYTAKLTREQVKEGNYCAELSNAELSSGEGEPSRFGNLMQAFDATPYRGKRVRFRAAVRSEGRSALWLRVDRQDGEMGFFDNMGDRPIQEKDWRYYEIVGDIAPDAERVNIGVMLLRSGKAWIDDASFQVVGDTPRLPVEAARSLTPRGLENEVAFARLYGLVRYFHPSDQAARADWNAFVIKGAREVESARNDAELAQKLSSLFADIAPTARVLRHEQKYSLPAELQPGDKAGLKITFWQHHGMGQQNANTYHSERVNKDADSADGDKTPRPGSPWKAELSSGVTAWVPLALYVDSKGTLPHAPDTVAGAAPAEAPAWSADDRGTRLADVIMAWNIFEHFYPYFDVVKTDWAGVLPKALARAANDKDESAFNDTLRGLIAELHDGHGGISKGNPRASLPLAWDWIEDKLVITAVSDSIKGRISPGDVVLTINGQPAAQALAAQEVLVSGATRQWIRYRGLQSLRGGRKDQTANLTIERLAEPGKSVDVPLQYVTALPVQEHRPARIEEIQPGIFYVDIARIAESDLQSALPQLEKAQGIIFDFRGYPSLGPAFLTYLSDHPLLSAQWHVPDVLWPDRHDMQFSRGGEWNLQPAKPFLAAKKAFIIDGRAISYAESCMGIVEYYKLGAIVGSPTAGTNGNVNPVTLPGGYTITWTGMKVLKQDGSRHHGVGIMPTIPVSRTRAGVAAGHDEFLDAAIKAVKD